MPFSPARGLMIGSGLVVALLAGFRPAHAQAPREAPPPAGPDRPFDFPSAAVQRLPNGLTVLVIEDRRQPLVSLSLVVPAGAAALQPAQAGLAAMTAGLLDKGTASRSAQDIARTIDRVGGTLTATADADFAQVSATVLRPSTELAFELLADVVVNPAFREDEVERLRRQVLSGLQVQFADAEFLASAVARRLVFGDHPYGMEVSGTPETVRALRREDIVAFHRARYRPDGAYLAVAGDIDPEAAFELARRHFGVWTGRAEAVAPPGPAGASRRRAVFVDKPDAVQTQIRVSTVGVPRNHPDYLPLLVANQAFGGSFNSRLNMTLRANEGLTYGARSLVSADRLTGWWGISTYTRTEETERAVQLIEELLADFRRTPITDAELAEAKNFLVGSFPIGAETAAQVADKVLDVHAYGLADDYWRTYRDRIRAITAAQVADVVRRYVDPERLSLVAVGNAGAFAGRVRTFGEPTVIALADLDLTRPDLRRPDAVTTTSAAGVARGREIIDKAIAAMGGLDRLRSVREIVTTGDLKLSTPMGELSGRSTTEVVYPDRSRSVVSLPVGQMVQAFDGTTGWMLMGPNTMDLPPAMHVELRRGIVTTQGIDLLRRAVAGEAEVVAIEAGEVAGQPADVVAWKQGDLELRVFFDGSTHLIAKLAYRSVTPQGVTDVEVFPSDYRDVDGLKLPFKVVGRQNGQPYLELAVSEVKLNPGIDPAVFRKP